MRNSIGMFVAMMLVVLFGLTSVSNAATWTVKKGDTPSKIAKKLNVSVKQVLFLAHASDARHLRIGVRIDTDKLAAKKSCNSTVSRTFNGSETAPSSYAINGGATSNSAPALIPAVVPAKEESKSERDSKNDPASLPEGDTEKLKNKFASATPDEPYVAPPNRPNKLKTVTAPFELGKSFNEVGLTLGGYFGDNGIKGYFPIAEFNHWNEQKDAGRNLSLLGMFLMYENGSVNGGYNWSKVKVLYQPGIYDVPDEHETYHLLLKPRIGVSFDSGTVKETNFTLGEYAEFDKTLDPLNRFGLIVDTMLELRKIGTDGQVCPRGFYEFGFGDEGKTIMPSIGPIWHVSPGNTQLGGTGALSYRVPVGEDFAWQLTATIDITKNEKVYGGNISVTWDDIMHVFQSKGRH